MKNTILLVTAAAIALLAPLARAIDPLPPEIENGPLEKKIAYWQKASRDGAELKHKVALQRYNQGLARKQILLSNLEDRRAEVKAQIAAEAAPAQVQEGGGSAEEGSSAGFYLILVAALGGGAYLMHRQMREAEQPV